jgi:hypothetical protein
VLSLELSEDPTGLTRTFSLRKEMPDVFHRLLSAGAATMTILPEHFPFVVRALRLELGVAALSVHAVLTPNATVQAIDTTFTVAAQDADLLAPSEPPPDHMPTVFKASVALPSDKKPSVIESVDWALTQTGLTEADIEDIVFILNYTIPDT